MALGSWGMSAIASVATAFMGWVFAHVKREQRRKTNDVMMISNIRTVSALLETEDIDSDDVSVAGCTKAAQKGPSA